MRAFSQNEPLKDDELDRLGDFLQGCASGHAMNIEELDGFFAALIAGPEAVMPSEYFPEVFGGPISKVCVASSLDEVNDMLGLMTRHWNSIAATLHEGEVYVPLLLEDENNLAHGNDWADGYIRGVSMRQGGWSELINDEEHGGVMIPMFMLHYENDEDPKMRPEPISPEHRDQVIAHMAAGLLGAYKYFRSGRGASTGTNNSTHQQRRSTSTAGRNDPCPCGSGKKYKKCCGGTKVN